MENSVDGVLLLVLELFFAGSRAVLLFFYKK